MENFKIKIELLSESIFGNGETLGSLVDTEILKDDLGFPYLKGKTFKGKLREEMFQVATLLDSDNKLGLKDDFENIMGIENNFKFETLKFSDCKVSKGIQTAVEKAIKEGVLTEKELTDSLTEIRSFTRLENGVAKYGALRNARVIKKGLILYCNLDSVNKLSKKELGLLSCALKGLRSLGMMESRGKGEVKCSLLKNEEDITNKSIIAFRKEIY